MSAISAAEIKASQEIDNLSISEIIQQRFKKNVSITEVNTPQEVAQLIIKGPEEANLITNVEGDETQQQAYNNKISDIETNRMYVWSDMSKVKKDLWKKLHQVKDLMKKQATNFAQIVSTNAQKVVKSVHARMPITLQESMAELYSLSQPPPAHELE